MDEVGSASGVTGRRGIGRLYFFDWDLMTSLPETSGKRSVAWRKRATDFAKTDFALARGEHVESQGLVTSAQYWKTYESQPLIEGSESGRGRETHVDVEVIEQLSGESGGHKRLVSEARKEQMKRLRTYLLLTECQSSLGSPLTVAISSSSR